MKLNVVVEGNRIVGYISSEPQVINGIKIQTGLNPLQGQTLHEIEVDDRILLSDNDHSEMLQHIKDRISYKTK